MGEIAAPCAAGLAADLLGPVDFTPMLDDPSVTSTVPSSSVRSTCAPCARSLAIVPGAG
jgi:hypothetical protein